MEVKKPSRREKAKGLEKINTNINFDRESIKTNARKWPTKVICILCSKKFELPFKPRKPEVYCDDCFKKTKKMLKPRTTVTKKTPSKKEKSNNKKSKKKERRT